MDILAPPGAAGSGHIWWGLIREVDESETPFGYPTYQSDYLNTYKNLLDGPLELSKMLTMVNNIESVIAAEVDADPYQQLGITAAEEFQRIRDFLTDRTAYVTAQLEALTPPPGTILLDDGFEGGVWDANWTNVNWLKDTGVYAHGSTSAKGDVTGTLTCVDLDANGSIELSDLKIMCGNWLGSGPGDFDNDGTVALDDFAEFAAAWQLR